MANRTGKKSKKPLQTTLGKAADTDHNEKDIDLSHVQKPINTSVFGLRQVLSLFQTATKEVQNYITYECDIMYECRTCRTIFRSLANFILHKRDYCRERFKHLHFFNNNEEVRANSSALENTQNIFNIECNSLSSDKKETSNTRSLSPVIERLKEKQAICQLAQEVLKEDLSSKKIVEENDCNESGLTKKNDDLLLEEIPTNNAAVFQTALRNLPKRNIKKPEFMKSEVMEIHGILDSDEAVLGPDGKICTFETNKVNANPIIPKSDLFCTECNLKFSTKKTLTYHVKYKHNNTRLVYVCPDCKDTFANAWCVYRHLYKIHRKTSAQIKRMREQIHNSCIRKDQEPVKKKDKKSNEKADKADEENQWLDNIEGDKDFQMCGGCGKRFERKAALHSHAQMCIKRIAVCNTIKENNAKKKEEESKEELCKDLKNKTTKSEKGEILKGSSKRKPYLLRTYKTSGAKTVLPSEERNVCDVNANCEVGETNCDNRKDIAEEKVTHKEVRNCSSSSEYLLSPSKCAEFGNSPSIEKIDTEKMLHIIGITNYEKAVNDSNSYIDSNCISDDKNVQRKISKDAMSHTASDFDLFCQTVSQNLLKSPLRNTSRDMDNCNKKPCKTVPLILRKKCSPKIEEKDPISEQSTEPILQVDMLNENKKENNKSTTSENESIVQVIDTNELNDLSANSTFKINVKSLEDLIGVSPYDHIKNLESKEVDVAMINDDVQIETNLDQLSNTDCMSKLLTTLEANRSPDRPCEKSKKCLKRKRTSSFDFTESNKGNGSKSNFFSNKQNISFISRASPFMDQNKFLCKPCEITYPTLSKLLWHMSAHFSWFRFQCSRCPFISFSKVDCANHARKTHFVKKSSIHSVVLPIPNWKTVLMSHDFCLLNDENDLSGKLTDEIMSGNSEESDIMEDIKEKIRDTECDESEWSNRLFAESGNVDSEPESDPLESDISPAYTNIKQESIDVIENGKESFQVEVPQEIYTLDISEIIDGGCYEERCPYITEFKKESIDEDDEDVNINDYFSEYPNNEIFLEEVKIKKEITSDDETEEKLLDKINNEADTFENQKCSEKHSHPSVKIRPIRNRTRSIKTLQEDFFYDLSKVIKLNGTSLSRSNVQKSKKSSNTTSSQKNSKDSSASASGNRESKHLRVYSKRR